MVDKQSFSSVKIPTKPHIKHYLEHHFGSPCLIPSGHFINEHLNLLLSTPKKYDNCKTVPAEESVIICINEKTGRRYGYGLTQTNRRNFNLVIDNFIKMQIRLIAENILNNNHRNEDWRIRYMELKSEHENLLKLAGKPLNKETLKEYKKLNIQINKRLKEHRQNRILEKRALIEAAEGLGFNTNMISMEALKQDFYRYRMSQIA